MFNSVALRGSRWRVHLPADPAHAVGGVCTQMEHKLVRATCLLSVPVSFVPVTQSLAHFRKHGRSVNGNSAVLFICSWETQGVGHILLWGYLDEKSLERGSHVALCFCGWVRGWGGLAAGQPCADSQDAYGLGVCTQFPLPFPHRRTHTTADCVNF